MTSGRGKGWAMAGVIAMALGAGGEALEAQRPSTANPEVGISLLGADPQGAMGQLVDDGWGAQLYGTWPLDEGGHLRLRGDLGFVNYGHERYEACFSSTVGCRIALDVTTTNNIFFGGLGPELVLATGRLQPYVNASFGFSWFATSSSLSGVNEWEDWANTTNYDDGGFAWRAGGGLRIRVSNGRKPVSVDLALERHNNGVVEYLTEGDIVDNPDGSVSMFPTRSQADLVAFRIGVSIGIPRGGDDDHDRRRRRR